MAGNPGWGVGVFAAAGGWSVAALRRLECGLVEFGAECGLGLGLGARKRCGEGVWAGMLMATVTVTAALVAAGALSLGLLGGGRCLSHREVAKNAGARGHGDTGR